MIPAPARPFSPLPPALHRETSVWMSAVPRTGVGISTQMVTGLPAPVRTNEKAERGFCPPRWALRTVTRVDTNHPRLSRGCPQRKQFPQPCPPDCWGSRQVPAGFLPKDARHPGFLSCSQARLVTKALSRILTAGNRGETRRPPGCSVRHLKGRSARPYRPKTVISFALMGRWKEVGWMGGP